MGKPRLDLSGKTFGRLWVLECARLNRRTAWSCRCTCGAMTVVRSDHLLSGVIASCGCLMREAVSARRTIHGLTGSPEYYAWHGMKRRCQDPLDKGYKTYGAKGIVVAARWQSFENFFADMGPRPSQSHSLDRFPNNRGNYEPGNVRWATDLQQGRNKTNNRLVEFEGRRQCLSAWASERGIKYDTLYQRLVHLRWSVERAMVP